ncbi:MAG: glycosyltransferase [Hyphomicrobiaceae bacterium]
MRIDTIHIVQKLAPGGIETLVLDLLVSGGGATHVFSLDGTTDGLVSSWPALEAVRDLIVGFDHKGGFSPRLMQRLAGELAARRPRAVVVHHMGPLVYGGIAARLARVPVLVHVEHDGWHLEGGKDGRLTQMVEWLSRPRHVAVSQAVSDSLAAVLPHAEIRVITNGLDLARFMPGDKAAARRRLGLPVAGRIIGSVGRLTRVKGHDVLVAAAELLPADVLVAIVGDGAEAANLHALASSRGVGERVRFLGQRDDIAAILPAFDVFCLPSRSEGLPRSIIEAQACGVPVVATDVGGVSEAICPLSGALVPPEDPAALAVALTEVLAASSLLSPRPFVEQRFAWADTLAGYAEVTGVRHAA